MKTVYGAAIQLISQFLPLTTGGIEMKNPTVVNTLCNLDF